ncbi:hypothetical protein LX36DRAFT_547627, partial [Colletotrichum falcatum]
TPDPPTPSSPPPSSSPRAVAFMRLARPVIIPQRRIMNRSRGFVCNYSSSLRDAGINEKAFSTFIDQLNRLAELKPRAQAIDFSGFAHLCPNTHHDVFFSVAVGMAFETAKGIQHGTAMNKLVDKTNDELFRPRGLVCLLMTWKPEGPQGSSPDRATRARPLQMANSEHRGGAKGPKANLGPVQGKGMLEWPQPAPLKRIDGDANALPETGISTPFGQHHILSHGTTNSIYGRTSQRLTVHHLEDRHGSQVATVEIGIRARPQEEVPFELAEAAGIAPLKSQGGQIALSNLGGRSTSQERDANDCGPGPFWNPAPAMAAAEAKEGQTEDLYLRRDVKGPNPFSGAPSPSFTTGTLKALETETLYVLIANMPDDEETPRDAI